MSQFWQAVISTAMDVFISSLLLNLFAF